MEMLQTPPEEKRPRVGATLEEIEAYNDAAKAAHDHSTPPCSRCGFKAETTEGLARHVGACTATGKLKK